MVTYRDKRTGKEHTRAERSAVLDDSPRFERVTTKTKNKTKSDNTGQPADDKEKEGGDART